MTSKTFEKLMSEVGSVNIEEALANAEKCLEAFTVEDIIEKQQKTIESQKVEIERLHKEVDRLSQVVLYHDGEVADAIKEFAERLKVIGARNNAGHILFVEKNFDNLVNEMVGGTE